jgi:hypothetical protein
LIEIYQLQQFKWAYEDEVSDQGEQNILTDKLSGQKKGVDLPKILSLKSKLIESFDSNLEAILFIYFPKSDSM